MKLSNFLPNLPTANEHMARWPPKLLGRGIKAIMNLDAVTHTRNLNIQKIKARKT